jgi:hypothetical protein
MKKYAHHLAVIFKHKIQVFKACYACGLTWRGIKHDVSKLLPVEFFEYANNYVAGSSPVNECKRKYGRCNAWQHHSGCNSHHWQYWVDWEKSVPIALEIPKQDLVELLCDWIGAGKTYNKDKWTKYTPIDYFFFVEPELFIHEKSKTWLKEKCMRIAEIGWPNVSKEIRKELNQ